MLRYLLDRLSAVCHARAGQETVTLKPGPGLDAVTSHMLDCHTLNYIRMNSAFLTPDEWKAEVTKMQQAYGAPIDDDRGRPSSSICPPPTRHAEVLRRRNALRSSALHFCALRWCGCAGGSAAHSQRRYSNCPPSTTMVWPVIHDASGEARNSTTFATSSGRPSRPNGMERSIALYRFGIVGLAFVPDAAGEFDRARRHAVHADAVLRIHRRLRRRVVDHRGLDRAVGRLPRRCPHRGDRRGVHHAALGILEERQRGLGGVHDRHHVHRHADRPAGLVVGRAETGCVVDQDVDAAECLRRIGDVAADRRAIGQVADCRRAPRGRIWRSRCGSAPASRRRARRSTPRRRPRPSPARSSGRCHGCRHTPRRACR